MIKKYGYKDNISYIRELEEKEKTGVEKGREIDVKCG